MRPVITWFNTRTGFRWLCAFFFLTAFVFSIVPLINLSAGRGAKDYALWYHTGQSVLHGENIYPGPKDRFPFMYPPSAAEMLALPSSLGEYGLIAALTVLNSIAWLACNIWSVRLTSVPNEKPNALLYLVPNLIIIAYVWSSYLLGQPTLLLLALLLGAFLCLHARRFWSAGLLVALATVIKAFPFATVVYFVYRRYWIAALSMVLWTVLLLLVFPAGIRGWSRACDDLSRWSHGMLFKYDERGIAQRPERSVAWKNQSLTGVVTRLLRHVDVDATRPPNKPVYVNFADLPFNTVNYIVGGIFLLLGLAYLSAMPPAAQRTWETDAIEWSLLLLLLLISSPLAFGYLFSFLLLPLAVCTRTWLVRPESPLRWWAITAVFLLFLTLPFQRWSQRYGNTCLATLILFIGLCLELRRMRRAPALA